jgi:hypothetical protein
MKNTICNFFAVLTDNTVRKIDLMQNINADIKSVFTLFGEQLLNEDTQEIMFDGNYAVQEEEISYVDFILPVTITDSVLNSIGTNILNIKTDDVKALFWYEDNVFYLQNFDKRKLLNNKNVIFYDKTAFNQLKEDALIIDNVVNSIYKNGKFYFKNFVNANKIFDLSNFYKAATDAELNLFASNVNISVDAVWLVANSNTLIRKQVTLIEKSGILKKPSLKKIKTSALKFNLTIDLLDGKLILPSDKKMCKAILSFLNEQYYFGLITGKKYTTNSKKESK